ncbi:hypothetical protein FOCC_FOCC011784 [Frankliniella occidentalis]|nr:hypothetical protein FOCC_FOCC011784 [Frankliniella occidentalis]
MGAGVDWSTRGLARGVKVPKDTRGQTDAAVVARNEVAQVFGQRIDWCRVACGVPGQPPTVIGIMACSRCCNGWCTLDSRKCKCP